MIVYHGSYKEISNPDIYHSRKKVDFGSGFYVTEIESQARNLCERFIRRGKQGIVSVYSLDDNALNTAKTLKFEGYSDEWLDFVFICRRLSDDTDYEIVVGGVANDRVFDTVELYFDGLISKTEALGRLVYTEPNQQICIRSQEILDRFLHFERSYVI